MTWFHCICSHSRLLVLTRLRRFSHPQKMATDGVISAADLSACETKAFAFLLGSAQTKAQVTKICDKTDTTAQSLGTCNDLYVTMAAHYKANKMVRCQSDLLGVATHKMMCVVDDAGAYCPFAGWTGLFNNMP